METEKPLIETVPDVTEVLGIMQAPPRYPPLPGATATIADIQDVVTWGLNRVREAANRSAGVSHNSGNQLADLRWGPGFLGIGDNMLAICDRLSIVVDPPKFAQMLINKHRAYGPGPLTRWGPLGIIIRIDSKWQRYLNLTDKPELDRQREPIQDTLLDILGYCVLGYKLAERSSSHWEQA